MWEGVGERTKTAIYCPPLLWPSALCLSRSQELLNQRARGPLCWMQVFLPHLVTNGPPNSIGGPDGPFGRVWLSLPQLVSNSSGPQLNRGPRGPPSAGRWLSLPQLVSDFSGTQLADFLSTPCYIIVQSPTQSPTQSLEWHVCSSSSGNNCHAVQRSLSSGASVYEWIIVFYLVSFRQLNPPTRFLSITGHWNVSLPSGASLWNRMFVRVEGQYTTVTPSPTHRCIRYWKQILWDTIEKFHQRYFYL